MLHNGYYNPYLLSSYHPTSNSGYYNYPNYRPSRHDLEVLTHERERSEALAARRARRAQYLPPGDVDSDDEDLSGPPSQRETMYLEARRRQEELGRLETERRRREIESFRRRMEQEDQRAQSYQGSPSQASQKRSVPVNMRRSPPRKSTSPQTPIPPVIEYTQAHHDAAERIQKWYRRYRALKAINDVTAQFEQAKNELVFPGSFDFTDPDKSGDVITIPVALALEVADGDVKEAVAPTSEQHNITETTASCSPRSSSTIESDDYNVESTPSSSEDITSPSSLDSSNESSTPRLAYTKPNYLVHAYMERLDVLLIMLDGVQSYGSRKVRERRKEAARMIEKETARIESVWKDVWTSWVRERVQQ